MNGAKQLDEKSSRAADVLKSLTAEYPDAVPLLNFRSPYELVISVILSAQTTDSQVNRVTPRLFEKFPDAESLARADVAEVERIVHSTGFYRTKARNIIGAAVELSRRFHGTVPDTIDDLLLLPGVGRKSANVVVSHVHGLPGIIVDTHFGRVCRRLGFTSEKDPGKVEREIAAIIPPYDQTSFSMTVNYHGRYCCKARVPECFRCVVRTLCPFEPKSPEPERER